MTKKRPLGRSWVLFVLASAFAAADARTRLRAASAAPRTATPIFNPADLAMRTLPNGARVVARETRGSGLVAIQIWVRAGSRYETPATNGASHLIEHLVFQNDRADSAQQVIEDTGGTVNGETEKDSTRFTAVVPSESFEPSLQALVRSIMDTNWSQRDLLFARDAVMQELAGRLTNPLQHVNDLAFRSAFQSHPYRLLAGGAPDTLHTLTLAKLRQHHAQFYVANNVTLVVVGDINRGRIFEAAAAALAPFKTGDAARAISFPAETWTGVRDLTINLPFRGAALSFSFVAPGITTPDEVWPMDVLVTLLGDGRRSRLRKRLVEESKLAIVTDAQFLTQRDPGLFTVSLLCVPQNAARAQMALMDEMHALRDGKISDEEILRARATLEGTYAAQNETAEGQASSLGFYEAIATYETAVHYAGYVRAVTPAQVRAVARKYFGAPGFARVFIRSGAAPPAADKNPIAGLPGLPGGRL